MSFHGVAGCCCLEICLLASDFNAFSMQEKMGIEEVSYHFFKIGLSVPEVGEFFFPIKALVFAAGKRHECHFRFSQQR